MNVKQSFTFLLVVMLGFVPFISSGMNSNDTVQDQYSVYVESSVELEQNNVFVPTERNTRIFLFDNLNAFSFVTKECYLSDDAVELQSPPPEVL